MTLLTHVAVLSSFSTTLSPRSGGSQIFLSLFDCFDWPTHQRQARRDTWQLITVFNMILQFNYPTQYQLSIRPKIKNQWSSEHKTVIVNTIDHETARMLTFPSKVIQSSMICTHWSCVVMSRHVSCSCGTMVSTHSLRSRIQLCPVTTAVNVSHVWNIFISTLHLTTNQNNHSITYNLLCV